MKKIVVVCSGPTYLSIDKWVHNGLMEWYNPDFNRGEGKLQLTYDIRKAMLFDDIVRAHAYTQRVPVNHPITEWGAPNRPIQEFDVVYRVIDIAHERRKLIARGVQ